MGRLIFLAGGAAGLALLSVFFARADAGRLAALIRMFGGRFLLGLAALLGGGRLLSVLLFFLPVFGRAKGGGESRRDEAMKREEARRILGLKAGAAREEIDRAYKALMLKLHPDRGGSAYLAARINEARETLLREGKA